MSELEEYMIFNSKNIEMLNQCINIHTQVLDRHSKQLKLIALCVILIGIGMFMK